MGNAEYMGTQSTWGSLVLIQNKHGTTSNSDIVKQSFIK